MPKIGPIIPRPMAASKVATQPAMFRSLGVAASGLDAQRRRMDIIATNIANADVTRTPEGGPYRRQFVDLESASDPQFTRALRDASELKPADVASVARVARVPGSNQSSAEFGVAVNGVGVDYSEGPRVYEPGHPDADADGYVTYPNVRVTEEIVDLMDARRLFEANATVFQVAKAMLKRSIEI